MAGEKYHSTDLCENGGEKRELFVALPFPSNRTHTKQQKPMKENSGFFHSRIATII